MSNDSTSTQRIIVGVDGSANAQKAANWAVAHAKAGDTIVLISAWKDIIIPAEMAVSYSYDDSSARQVLAAEVARVSALAANDLTIASDFQHADPRTAILGQAGDLIVVGARGHGGIAGLLLGSVADYVSRHAKVPVVIVPK